MLDWKFFLNDIEIEEPIGFDDIEFSISRDDNTHGMQYEASTSALQFYGDAADYLRDQKKAYGVKANVVFVAQSRCNDESEYDEAVEGSLSFGQYKDTRGNECLVSLPVESDSCDVVLKNRYDQKVDIDSTLGFDGATVLPQYDGMNLTKKLYGKELFVGTAGSVAVGGYTFDITGQLSTTNDGHAVTMNDPTFYVRPIYARATMNSIDTGQVDEVESEYGVEGPVDTPVSPILLFEDNVLCFDGNFNASFRLKGSYNLNMPNASIQALELIILETDDITSASPHQVNYFKFSLPHTSNAASGTFDQTFSGTIKIKHDFGVYAVFAVAAVGIGIYTTGSLTWDEETSVSITANKACPPTDVKLSLVHEALSRATEAITNSCMRVKSGYYGRVDSQPFSFDRDGCGALRFLTSGLKIRRAVEDNFFASVKDLIEGLQAIDNIGMGVEPDEEIPGRFVLRVEAIDFFYQDVEILFHDSIPLATEEMQESEFYSKITVGYKKWEVTRVNGLDEFNSNREYRTDISSISNPLDITSGLIAGSYPLEITRQQSFVDTGGADTTYDNETFVITATRNAYGIEPEQGNIDNPQNIYSPQTSFNWKISPVRNLMRWYRSIINSYANVADTGNKLFFNSGTGNLVAAGSITPGSINDDCILESHDLIENQNLFTNDFARIPDYMPLYKNETVTYAYPMSISDYKKIKANPYGYISYQCGNDPIEKGYIKEVKYKPATGMANIVLRKKW